MNRDHLRLGLSFAGSIAVNTLVLAPVAVVVFTATPSSALAVDTTMQAQIEPPTMDDIELGIDDSDASTLTWVGYETYMEHLARQAEFEQAQLQAAKGERASGEPLPSPVTPQPTLPPMPPTTEQAPPQETPTQAPAQPTEPALETPVDEPAETPGEAPPAEAPPETIGLPIDPESTHPGLPADIPGAPQPGREPDEPGPELPGETPDETPQPTPAPVPPDTPAEPDEPSPESAPQTPPQQPEQPPTTPNVPPSPTPTESTSEPDPNAPKGVKGVDDAPLRLDGSDRDSDATSLVQVKRRDLNLGKPIAREGLKLYPRKPDFTSLQVVSSGGRRGVLARLVFKSTGRMRNGRMLPAEAYIGREVTSGPNKNTVRWSNERLQFDRLEQSIHSALFSWSATGRRIDELEKGAPVIINLELQIAVK